MILRLAMSLLLAVSPLGAEILPPSGVRVLVDKAAVEELACSRRPFALEHTRTMTRGFPAAARGLAQAPDPRYIAMGLASMLILVPLTVVAVPSDLVSAPFRRECDFQVRLEGRLMEWAGNAEADAEVSLQARNVLAGTEEDGSLEVYTSSASAVSDQEGRFSLGFPGKTSNSRNLDIAWKIKGRPASEHRLAKSGSRFILSEVDPGFGAGGAEAEPITIRPIKKHSASAQ